MTDIQKTLDAKKAPQEQKPAAQEQKSPALRYHGSRLRRIIRANGTVMLPAADGLYEPQSQEERCLCEYYVSIGMLELVK